MRKFFVKIATMALIGVLCLTSLFGCQLITTNNERDMAQKIATIQIDDAPMKIIYKRDVAVAYSNYVSSGYTGSDSELFTDIIESLIQNAVLVQYAMKYFAEKPDFEGEKWQLESYFEETEILDCKYNAYLQFEQLVEDYVKDKEEEKVGDVYTGSVRTVPTGATVNSEVSDERKEHYVDNYWAETITPMYNAFVKAVNVLKKNNLLGDYTHGDIETIEYFNQILIAYEESLLIEKLQEDIEKEARKTITFDKIQEEYSILYNEQANATNSTFETSLKNASAESPILFGQKGYGMVYHILLKADDDMTAELEDLKESYKNENGTPAYENSQYRKDRAAIFEGITAKDQRESWIKSRYDFGKQLTTPLKGYTLAFTGDYTLYSEQSLPFFGSVTHLNPEEFGEDDYKAKYRVDNVDKFSLGEILEIINEYLYDGTADVSNVKDRATYTASKVNDDYDKRIKELMFAFSQDDSDTALNTYKGYTIKPQPDGTEQEEWMLEFAEVGRDLIKANENTFMLVATDYGYHIMFFSENFDGYSYPTLEEYLNKEFKFSNSDITSWEEEFSYLEENFVDYENTDSYLYVLYNKLASTYVNNAYQNATQEIYADYANNSRVVVKYPDAYKDLVED